MFGPGVSTMPSETRAKAAQLAAGSRVKVFMGGRRRRCGRATLSGPPWNAEARNCSDAMRRRRRGKTEPRAAEGRGVIRPGLMRPRLLRHRHQLKKMAVGRAEIDAAAAAPVIDLAVLRRRRPAAVTEACRPDAAEDGVELRLAAMAIGR